MDAVDALQPAAGAAAADVDAAAAGEPAAALRPGEEVDADGNVKAKTKKPRPKLTYEDLTVRIFPPVSQPFHGAA